MPSRLDVLYEKADEGMRIKRHAFWISSCILFGLAIVTVLGRIFLKLRHKLKFGVDDYLVFFATGCLISGTGVMFVEVNNLYIGPVVKKYPDLATAISPARMQKIFKYGMLHQHVFFTLLWSCIFGVKFAFLAFFKNMISRMKGMIIYWWVTLLVLLPSWAAIVSMSFLLCPHFGTDAAKCLQKPNDKLYTAMMAVGGTLDSVTDLMIVSIPILVLRRVSLPIRQKVIVGAFLCLSLTMIVMTLTRSAKIHGQTGRTIDIRWAVYWVHIEACIAVIMVSLTSFRTSFNLNRTRTQSRERLKKPSSYLGWRMGNSDKSNTREIEMGIPRGQLTGVGTYFSGNKESFGESTVELSHKQGSIDQVHFTDEEAAHGKVRGMGPGAITPASSIEDQHPKIYASNAV